MVMYVRLSFHVHLYLLFRVHKYKQKAQSTSSSSHLINNDILLMVKNAQYHLRFNFQCSLCSLSSSNITIT